MQMMDGWIVEGRPYLYAKKRMKIDQNINHHPLYHLHICIFANPHIRKLISYTY